MLKHGLVVLDVAWSQNSLPFHPARRFDERLVVLPRIYFWKYSVDCFIRSTKGGGSSTFGKKRGMVYINVIPCRELNYVVETEKGERPSEEFVEIPRCWCKRREKCSK